MSNNIFNKLHGLTHTNFDLKEITESNYVEAQEAKKTLNQLRTKTQTVEEEAKALEKKFAREKNLYEEYDPSSFETKLRLDSLFYEHIFTKLPENVKGIEEAVASYYKTVKELYEVINIKAENYRQLNSNILTESIENQGKIFEQLVMEHLNNKYYRLPMEQRKTKFFDGSKEYAEELVTEGVAVEDAIALAVKTNIVQSLLENIAIPRLIQSRIKYLCEDKDYGKVFDQPKLKNLWESFKTKSKNMAKIVAISI